MSDRFVYLVQSDEIYERPTVVEAHLIEGNALERAALFNKLAEAWPQYPDDDSDEAYEVWLAASEAWKKAHPLGPEPPGYGNQRYEVRSVPLAFEPPA